MAQETQAYKRSLSGSVGAGLNSVFNKGGRTYYILEHKVSSKYHRAGEAQEIIVDQIELGRDPKCQVQYDESFKTVSRRHAAIVRDGNNWKLIQLSQTNTTFLNGRPISTEWYLQNGDEIQLSVNGPKLGFIVPSGNKSTVGSIGLSRRLSLFRQQALKPYKTAMAVMGVFIVLLIGGGITYGVVDHRQDIVRAELTQQQIDAANQRAEKAEEDGRKQQEAMRKKMEQMQRDFDKRIKSIVNADPMGGTENVGDPKVVGSSNSSLSACESSVYYVLMRKMVATFNGESVVMAENFAHGTGFLLDDGRFVTARHCVEPWMFIKSGDSEALINANIIANNGGTVVLYIDAYSPSGKKLSFVSTNAHMDKSTDKSFDYDGYTMTIAQLDYSDYAYFNTNERGGLSYNNNLSQNLPMQAKLTILGYPLNYGKDIHPLYSEAVVAKQGLENGRILTTATSFEQGNSGGPVFATTNDGKLIVVGIVSAGAGRSTGCVVPIANAK